MRDIKLPVQIIGWDSAVQEANNGLAAAEFRDGKLKITDLWDHKTPLSEVLHSWITRAEKTLLAIDCPLGWPASFGSNLAGHQAGFPIKTDPLRFFKRQTDINIQERFGKIPLEVSADRIARTAFFTLSRLGQLADSTGIRPEMTWNPDNHFKLGMIEVYPAAILIASGLKTTGYKNRDNIRIRTNLLEKMQEIYQVSIPDKMEITTVEHDFDALLCCLSGFDFLTGKCEAPSVISEEIKKEGWTWIKSSD